MERHEGPGAEALVDHAWRVACAVVLGHRMDAAAAADRLVGELVVHDEAFAPARRYLEPHLAQTLVSSASSLRAGVARLAEELRAGTSWPRPALRSAVVGLILAEAAAVGDCASAYVD
jgi:hypothetical protein